MFISGFRKDFLAALSSLGNSPSTGWYINSCYSHCQSGTQETWLRNDSPLLDNTVYHLNNPNLFYVSLQLLLRLDFLIFNMTGPLYMRNKVCIVLLKFDLL